MADDFPTKPLDQSVIFNNRTDKINNTSDTTKSNPGNPIGDKIKAVQDFFSGLAARVTNNETAITALQAVTGSLPGIANATATEAASLRLVMLQDNGQFRQVTSAETKLFIESIAMPKTYPVTLENQVVSEAPHILIGNDPDLRNVTVQCYDMDIAFTPGTGKIATFDGTTASIKQAAGELKTYTEFGTKPWSFVSRQPEGGPVVASPVPLFITMGRLTASYTAPKLTADDRLQYLPDSVDDRWRAEAVAMLNSLDDTIAASNNTLLKIKYLRLSGASQNNNAINLANPFAQKKATYNGNIANTPYLGDKGDGVTGWIGTGLKASDVLHDINGSFIMLKPSDTTLSDGVMIGNHQSNSVAPNRSATLAAIKSSSSGQDTTASAAGKAIAINRTSSAGYDVYVDGVFTEAKTRTATITTELPFNLLATNTSTGAGFTAPSSVGLDWVVMAPNLQSAATIKKIYDAMMRMTAINAVIRANP